MLKNHWNDCISKYNTDQIFGLFLQGSQNYELDTVNSDIDSKCLLLPSLEDIIFGKQPVSTTFIRDNEEHIDFKDARNYFRLFVKQNINIIEILFTKDFIINDTYRDLWNELISIREDVAHINPYKMCKMIAGMSMEKHHALCHEYPSKKYIIAKYGYDSKQLHHIIRLRDFIERYIVGESFEDCLIPTNKQYLLDIKENNIIYTAKEADDIAKQYCDEIYSLYSQVKEQEDNIETIKQLNNILTEIIKRKLAAELTT